MGRNQCQETMTALQSPNLSGRLLSLSLAGEMEDTQARLLPAILGSATKMHTLDLGERKWVTAGRQASWWHEKATGIHRDPPSPEPCLSGGTIRNMWISMASNSTLTFLNLKHRNIQNMGATHLSIYLERWPGLTHLNLSTNMIGNSGASHLSKAISEESSPLRHYDISFNDIGESGLKALADNMPTDTIETLNLKMCLFSNRTVPEAIVALSRCLGRCTSLTKLNLAHLALGDEGTSTLMPNLLAHPNLTHMDFRGNWTSDRGIQDIASLVQHNTALRSLKMVTSPADGTPAYIVAGSEGQTNSHLRSLDWSHTDLNQRCIEAPRGLAVALSQYRGLTDLRLVNNGLNPASMVLLAKSLKSSSQLSHIDVSCNHAGPISAGILARHHPHLQTIILRGCGMGKRAAADLGRGIAKCSILSTLNVSGNDLKNDGIATLLREAPTSITHLDLSRTGTGTGGATGLEGALQRLHISNLDISDNLLNDQGSRALQGDKGVLRKLTQLSIGCNLTSEAGAADLLLHLSTSTTLRQLDLSGHWQDGRKPAWTPELANMRDGCIITGVPPPELIEHPHHREAPRVTYTRS
jgi:Ran GTPase-activating protein (RanGAP) involved in mRNA processing and transport